MPNAKDASTTPFRKILLLGSPGSGKSTQIHTLPGRKFAYLFDPNALIAIQGADVEYAEFLPDALELDASMKAFNKVAKPSDRMAKPPEPTTYVRWYEDFNKRVSTGFFKNIDWLVIDSLSSLVGIMFDRLLWVNNRYGEVEDQADLKIVGAKVSDVFRSVTGEDVNLFCTGHLNTYRDDKTQKISVEMYAPGRARRALPIRFTDIWQAEVAVDPKDPAKYVHQIRTKPDPRGYTDIRSSIAGLAPVEDVTLPIDARTKRFVNPENHGIGAILKRAQPRGEVA